MSGAPAVADGILAGWIEAYGSELRAHLGRFVEADDAEDLLQQVWITAHRRPPAGGPSANVRAWLYRVATNAALDRLARERRRRRLLEQGAHRVSPEPGADANEPVPDHVRIRVRAAVARLPMKQREAVWLRWADGLEYRDIGERLGCSSESARANVYQGMKRLRRDLSEVLREEAE